jgi:hypothetical protein
LGSGINILLTRIFAGWDEAEGERQAGEPLGQGPLHGHLSVVQVGSKQATAQYTYRYVRVRLRENMNIFLLLYVYVENHKQDKLHSLYMNVAPKKIKTCILLCQCYT